MWGFDPVYALLFDLYHQLPTTLLSDFTNLGEPVFLCTEEKEILIEEQSSGRCVLQCAAVCASEGCSVCRNVLQCVAVCCSVLQCVLKRRHDNGRATVGPLQCVAVC